MRNMYSCMRNIEKAWGNPTRSSDDQLLQMCIKRIRLQQLTLQY